jgi:hypothetical protein
VRRATYLVARLAVTGVTPGCVDWHGRLDQEDGGHNADQRPGTRV